MQTYAAGGHTVAASFVSVGLHFGLSAVAFKKVKRNRTVFNGILQTLRRVFLNRPDSKFTPISVPEFRHLRIWLIQHATVV